MAIRVENNVFYLETAHTLYQMKADNFGVLQHLWYGPKTDCCMDYLLAVSYTHLDVYKRQSLESSVNASASFTRKPSNSIHTYSHGSS